MRTPCLSAGVCALLSLVPSLPLTAEEGPAASSAASTPSHPPATPSAGVVNDWLRSQSDRWKPWDFGAQLRARYEFRDHFAVAGAPDASDFRRTSSQNENSYLLLRERVHAGYRPANWVSVFAEAQNSSSTGDRRDPNPESNGLVDVHQAHLTLGGVPGEFPLSLKAGRQELSYGDERVIGAFDWNNVGRVFDAAKLRFEDDLGWIDGFAGRVVISDDNNLDLPNDYDWFSGVYASTRSIIPKQETQLYFLSRNVGRSSPNILGSTRPALLKGASARDIYTLGLRVKSLPGQFGGWDYESELAGQWGDFAGSATGPRLSHEAFAAHLAGGYTWKEQIASPRAGLEYNYASGDDNPTDKQHGTFENLFPTNHRFYGFMDFFSWQNMHNVRAFTVLKPAQPVTLTLDYHAFWLADTHDFFYQANGSPRSTGGYGIAGRAGSFAGHEFDLIATYAPRTYASLQVGYGHFFVGDYVRDSLRSTGGASDANWIYAQATLNF